MTINTVEPAPLSTPAWRRPGIVLLAAAGGFLGAPARYGIGELIVSSPGDFPWATFVINISGAFLLGALYEFLAKRLPGDRMARALFGTGFLGSYTTFSTYMVETTLLGKGDHYGIAAAYLFGSLLLGLLASWLGMCTGRRAGGAR